MCSDYSASLCPGCPYRQKDREAATEGRSLVHAVVAGNGAASVGGSVYSHQRKGSTGLGVRSFCPPRRDLARNGGRQGHNGGQREAGLGVVDGSAHRRSLQKSHAVASACESSPELLTGILPSSPRHVEALGQ